MSTFTIPIPAYWVDADTADDLGQAVTEYLAVHNPPIVVDGVAVQRIPDPALVVYADQDPTDALRDYAGTVSADRDRLIKARQLAIAYRDKVLANQAVTAIETAKALAAVITLVERLAKSV